MKKITIQKAETERSNILMRMNVICKRLNIPLLTEYQEDEGTYFAEIDITTKQVNSLPVGLKKLIE